MSRTAQKLTVLVVDDDSSIRRLFQRLFESQPHELRTAESGEAAAALAQSQHFDLVFLDVRMPGIDGLETFRLIRQAQPGTIVVLMTGYAEEERIEQALREGALTWLKKPFDVSRIIGLVDRVSSKAPEQVRVLVADDNVDIREMFVRALRSPQIDLRTVDGFQPAIDYVKHQPFDLIFLDMRMPDGDVVPAVEAIRAAVPKAVLVLMTGYSDAWPQVKKTLHSSDYIALDKPFDISELQRIISSVQSQSGCSRFISRRRKSMSSNSGRTS